MLSRIEMRLLLEMSGYQVDEVSDGMEAIGLLDMAAPGLDLVVLDYLMPQLNGLETYEALRALRPGLGAIICVSGIEDIRAGAIPTTVTFLKKPCTMHTLSDALERVHGLVRHSLSHGKAGGFPLGEAAGPPAALPAALRREAPVAEALRSVPPRGVRQALP